MAIAFDAQASSSIQNGTDSTCTVTVGSGSDRALLIIVVRGGATSPATPTVNGSTTGVTLWNTVLDDESQVAVDVYRKLAPATGANAIETTESEIIAGLSYSGVHQTTPLGSIFEAGTFGTAVSLGVTGTSAGHIVVGFLGWNSDSGARTFTADGSNPTRINDPGGAGQSHGVAVIEETSGGGTVTMSGTISSGTPWTMTATVLNASDVGPSNTDRTPTVGAATFAGIAPARVEGRIITPPTP